jgi:Cof subfamily protein (haloacid dehalogenase superfamily)
MVKLIAIDIDGTLLGSDGRIPEANREALERVAGLGIEIVLATGRRYDFARPVFEQLDLPLTLVLSNGAIVKTRDGVTLIKHLLPRNIARDVLASVPEHRAEAAVIFDRPREGQVVYERIDWEHPQHRWFFSTNRPYLIEIAPLEHCLTEDPVQVMFTGSCAAMRGLAAGLDGDGRFSVALTEYQHRDFSLLDVVRAGCSKGSALRQFAATRGVPASAVMAFGDNLNDLTMLQFAGTAVVMGNAVAELKARGWMITGTNDEAGVAQALETIM